MEQANKNNQSRGVLRLETSEEFKNSNLKKAAEPTEPKASYNAENFELESMLADATATKEDERKSEAEQNQAEQQESSKKMSSDDAAKLAVMGLGQLTNLIAGFSNKEISIPKELTVVFASLTAPLIQKYSTKISLQPDSVDLDSWQPEIMALVGFGVVGLPIYKQMTEVVIAEQQEKQPAKGEQNGDKS